MAEPTVAHVRALLSRPGQDLSLQDIPREWLQCRGYGHSWDYGPAPTQFVSATVWATRGRCRSCTSKSYREMQADSCRPLKPQADYTYVDGYLLALHLVTKWEARREIARRDMLAVRGVA